jgi:hypothetical protein
MEYLKIYCTISISGTSANQLAASARAGVTLRNTDAGANYLIICDDLKYLPWLI